VVGPDEIVRRYGTDTLRMYELFVGPPEMDSEWNDRGIEGIYRFLKRAWRWTLDVKDRMGDADAEDVLRQRHILIKNCTERLEAFRFNTIISALMEFVNFATDGANAGKAVSRETVETFLILISPMAPHFAEELWRELGHTDTIFRAAWPAHDEALTKTDTVTVVVQINGKLRDRLDAPAGSRKDELQKMALALDKVQKQIEGKEIKTVVVVPDKLVNIVIK
jgi:leucyl-tRNA synthetase